MLKKSVVVPALCVLSFFVGCEFSSDSPDAYWNDATAAEGGEGGNPPANVGDMGDLPSDLSGVVFLHANVSGWAVTSNLRSVSVSGGNITLDYDKANVWPGRNTAGAHVNANPWVIVKQDGVWYAATWEWMRVGQTTKSAASVAGDHINRPPLQNFRPQSGEVYGFMVSGLARSDVRNVQERTNVVMYRWP